MERRTMVRIVLVGILFILLAGAACLGLVMCGSQTPLEGARAATLNTLLDQTGTKDRIESELYAQADTIAEQAGVPVSLVETGIDMLDVKDWQATVLPEDAQANGNFSTEVGGQQIGITTYEDSSYVTIDALGQSVTFDVPESAQTFTELAPYLGDAQALGILDTLGDLSGALSPENAAQLADALD